LVCPLTKGPLEYDAEKQELISRSAKLAYPTRDGIPIMLPEEARRLDRLCPESLSPSRRHYPRRRTIQYSPACQCGTVVREGDGGDARMPIFAGTTIKTSDEGRRPC